MESLSKTDTAGAPVLDLDFAKTIEESKQAVQSEKPKETKRGRGRPKKEHSEAPRTSEPVAPPAASPPDLTPYLATPIQMISNMPARKHKIPELALTPQEALDCAKALNECFNVFVPNMNEMSPKTAAILSAAMVFGSIGFSKYQIYAEVTAARAAQVQRPGDEPRVKNDSEIKLEPGQLPAENYFRR